MKLITSLLLICFSILYPKFVYGCSIEIHFYISYEKIIENAVNKEIRYDVVLTEEDISKENSFKKEINGAVIEGNIIDCMGALSFTVIDTAQNISIKGQFVNCPDTLKRLLFIEDPGLFRGEVLVSKYVTPLKDGIWIFYDNIGNTLEERKYNKGFRDPEFFYEH